MKRFLLFWTFILMVLAVFAQGQASRNDANGQAQREPSTHVTAAQAMDVGYAFMHTGSGSKSGGTQSGAVRKQAMQLVYTGRATDSLTRGTTDCYYVFALQPKGFVIVAADDRVEPILGYSYDNNFVVENMPAHVRDWLGDYEKQIQLVTKSDHQAEPDIKTKWSRLKSGQPLTNTRNGITVGPLLTTTWDQAPYYNALCPEDINGPNGHVVTGCVATAMAQIINYWGYPLHGRGSHSYNSYYGTLTVNYDSTYYDYANMPDALTSTSTPEQIDAVATLMYDCGVAVNMQYTSLSSGASIADARAALINFFRYSPDLSFLSKNDFSNRRWNLILRDNIDADHPIIYCGQNLCFAGHCFVCDGYDDNDFFHFNFGWSGDNDGWYLTSNINPNIDYSMQQTALVGIVPDSTGNIILGQTQGTSSFAVEEPMEFFHIMGHNAYMGANTGGNCDNSVLFVSADTAKQLVVDILSYENQDLTIYDDNYGNQLRTIRSRTNNEISPAVSSSSSLTVHYQGTYCYDGFQFRISQNEECRMVSNVTTSIDTTTVQLTWRENGIATQWELEYGLKGFSLGEGNTMILTDTNISLTNLISFKDYDVYIRPLCDTSQNELWRKITVRPLARCWKDVVISQPSGYVEDSLGNAYISSAEGLTWLYKLSMEAAYHSGGRFFQGRKVILTADIDLGGYIWEGIEKFRGIFDGQGHTVYNMYSNDALISWAIDAEVKNINLTNFYSTLGGLIRRVDRDMIVMNCFVSGIVDGNKDWTEAGGIISDARDGKNVYVMNCASNCKISGHIVGGIVGMGNSGSGSELHVIVRNCYSASEIYSLNIIQGYILGYGDYAIVENCYAYSEKSGYRLITYGGIETTCSDIDWFEEANNGFYILEPVFFETDSLYHVNLKDVLNAGVKKYNWDGLRLWVDDTSGINEGMPLLGPEYVSNCPNVKNFAARNVANENGEYGVELSWIEMGDAATWEIEWHVADSLNSVRTIITNNPDTLWGLSLQTTYIFRVRPKCGVLNYGGWSEKYTLVVDRPYWTDVVNSQPEGYSVDEDGNVTISSAEGLAWLSSVVNGLNDQIANDFDGKTVILIQDVAIGKYKWTAISGFKGTFNGGMHTIRGLYVNELTNCQGLFGNVPNGTYMNVNIDSANVKGGGLVGILVGQARLATIVNCHVSGTVYGETLVGGLVGNLANSYTVNVCSSKGVVMAKYDYVGGLIGSVGSGIMVDDDIIYTSIRNNYSRCTVEGGRYSTGGLIGEGDYIVENCYAAGNVKGHFCNGGVAGSIAQHWSYMRNCYGAGIVEDKVIGSFFDGYNTTEGFYFGSIVGKTAFSPTISNCYGLADPIIYWDGSTDTVLIGTSDDGTLPIVSNVASFTVVNDSVKILKNVTVGQTNYDNLLDALNAWVDTYDTTGMFLHWMTDTTDENDGLPVFDTKIRYNTLTLFVADSTPYGTVNGAGNYSNIEPTIIEAIPDYGYHFVCWNDGNTHNPRGVNLTQDTTFTAIFEKNLYGVVGNVVVNADFHFDFEDSVLDNQWTLLNSDFENRWCINTLDNSNRTLFVSNDNGISNTCFFQNFVTNVFAYTTMILDAGNYNYDFDWRAKGQGGNSYLRVALMPSSKPLNPNRWWTNSLPAGAIAIDGGSVLNEQTAWQHRSGNVNIPVADEYRLIFQWRSDLYGSNPPAAIDNIHFSRYDNVIEEADIQGDVLGSDTVPYLDTVMLTAVPYEGYRFSHWTDGNTDNPRTVVVSENKFYWAVFECAPYDIHDSIEVCGAYIWQDSLYTISTMLVESLISQADCDSVVTHHLTVNPIYDIPLTVNICEEGLPYHYINGQIDTIFGKNIPSQSTSIFHLSTVNGCDSVVTLYLTINHATNLAFTVDTCDWYTWRGKTYYVNGDYMDTLTDGNGCTQVDTLHLTINHATNLAFTVDTCDWYTWNGETYTTSGTYYYTYADDSNCTQVDTLYLTINHATNLAFTVDTCEWYTWNDVIYTESGTYYHTYADGNNCTQVDTLYLTINHATNLAFTVDTCDWYSWNDETYTASGTYYYTHADDNNCTQVDTLYLTIHNPVHTAITETACENFTWHGETYTESGTYYNTHADGNNCTQVDTLYLTINHAMNLAFTVDTCDWYIWNGETYTESGTYYHTHADNNNCTQIDTLYLTINHATNLTFNVDTCDRYTWNGVTYTTSGTYYYTHADDNNCTQVDTLYLTIHHATHNAAVEVACESYEWHNSTYTTSGIYTYEYFNENDCASVDTLHLTVNHSSVSEIAASSCDSYSWNGVTYTESGDYTQTFTAANGCDSVVTLHLTVNPSVNIEAYLTISDNDLPFTYGDTTFMPGTVQSGDYIFNFTTADGCDSVIILHLTVETGINDYALNASMKVYPNPTKDLVNVQLTINNEQLDDVEVQLFDVYGRLLEVVNMADARGASLQTTLIDLSRYAKGVYFVKAASEGKVIAVRKVVKR